MAVAQIIELQPKTHGTISWLHMARDATCQDSPLEAAIQDKHRPIPEISHELGFGNGCRQPKISLFNQQCLATAKVYRYTRPLSYGIQAASSFGVRRQTGVGQSLVGCCRAQIPHKNDELDKKGEFLQKRETVNFESQVLGRSAAKICHNSPPVSMDIPNLAHHSLYVSAHNRNTSDGFCENSPSSPGQDLDHDETSQCPSLASDSEDELEYSDFETVNGCISYTSGYGDRYLAIASTLAAYLLVHSKGHVSESKKDQHQSHIQNTGSKGERTQDSRDDHSSCSSRNSRARKRSHRHGNHDQESVNGSEDDGRKRARRTPSATGDEASGAATLLACPFYKYDRRRYSEVNLVEKEYRGCSSVYMTGISRLKQHLYRVHGRPDHYCSSCYMVFDRRSQLDSHIRSRPPCEIAKAMFTEKITDQQLIQLKRKQYGKTVAQNWYAIFEILFPQAEPPESPYLEDPRQVEVRNYLSIYQEFIQPRLMRELGLDEGGRQVVNSVLEQSTSQVLQQLAQERIPRGTEDPTQQPPSQSGCTSYQANQLHEPDYLYADNSTDNSFNTSELALPSTWCGGLFEGANSLELSTIDNAVSLSTDSLLLFPTPQWHYDTYTEPLGHGPSISQNLPEYPRFDWHFDDDPQPGTRYSY